MIKCDRNWKVDLWGERERERCSAATCYSYREASVAETNALLRKRVWKVTRSISTALSCCSDLIFVLEYFGLACKNWNDQSRVFLCSGPALSFVCWKVCWCVDWRLYDPRSKRGTRRSGDRGGEVDDDDGAVPCSAASSQSIHSHSTQSRKPSSCNGPKEDNDPLLAS